MASAPAPVCTMLESSEVSGICFHVEMKVSRSMGRGAKIADKSSFSVKYTTLCVAMFFRAAWMSRDGAPRRTICGAHVTGSWKFTGPPPCKHGLGSGSCALCPERGETPKVLLLNWMARFCEGGAPTLVKARLSTGPLEVPTKLAAIAMPPSEPSCTGVRVGWAGVAGAPKPKGSEAGAAPPASMPRRSISPPLASPPPPPAAASKPASSAGRPDSLGLACGAGRGPAWPFAAFASASAFAFSFIARFFAKASPSAALRLCGSPSRLFPAFFLALAAARCRSISRWLPLVMTVERSVTRTPKLPGRKSWAVQQTT
mmetsp:Transcript_783/g.3225  ORF Transcript_783/g.3225 Transcript_783/m.3225 type:complete len:315 (+) Transcript_783:443-1387(+)